MDGQKVILEIRTPRSGEETPEAMAQVFASIASIKAPLTLLGRQEIPFSFEIACVNQSIRFFAVVPRFYQSFIESQITSQYPKATISELGVDYFQEAFPNKKELSFGQLKLEHNFLYPLKTTAEFKDVDPLSSLLGMLSKLDKGQSVVIQYLLVPTTFKWQRSGQSKIENKSKADTDPLNLATYSKEISEKVSHPGMKVGIRLMVNSSDGILLSLIAATFANFNNVKGNSLKLVKPFFFEKDGLLKAITGRTTGYVPYRQILNIKELSTLFHFPGLVLNTIQSISWAKTILSEPPENLPVATNFSEEERKNMNFFAKTDFKGKPQAFGIKRNDRRRHVYIVGKTGTGKSTLIANMAVNDILNGEGLCVIDPHGDLCETLLDYIPEERINDVVYLNPSDLEYPFRINPLEVTNLAQKELVASGIVSIFYKLYGDSWGPRLEYILRIVILTLVNVPNATLMMVPDILTNSNFRKKIIPEIKDPVLRNYWENEFNRMPDRQREEAIAPILNKVGQFLSSNMMRNIVGYPTSTINLEELMNTQKIVLMNLSQGKIGEDNARLLGAMLITKFQLAAMNRVYMAEDDRKDFYLYVDEFQNFATTSFIKILSEARKYRLCLILANQYMAQIDPEVRSAIFGNAGTILSFIVGAEDTPFLAKEFGERFKEEDLLALNNYQMLMKMYIDGLTSTPFFSHSMPMPSNMTQSREKVISSSRERYTKREEAREELPPPPVVPPLESDGVAQEGQPSAPDPEETIFSKQLREAREANAKLMQEAQQLQQGHPEVRDPILELQVQAPSQPQAPAQPHKPAHSKPQQAQKPQQQQQNRDQHKQHTQQPKQDNRPAQQHQPKSEKAPEPVAPAPIQAEQVTAQVPETVPAASSNGAIDQPQASNDQVEEQGVPDGEGGQNGKRKRNRRRRRGRGGRNSLLKPPTLNSKEFFVKFLDPKEEHGS